MYGILGHAKRNCSSEADEPPLRFGMIVEFEGGYVFQLDSIFLELLRGSRCAEVYCWRTILRDKPSAVGDQRRTNSCVRASFSSRNRKTDAPEPLWRFEEETDRLFSWAFRAPSCCANSQ